MCTCAVFGFISETQFVIDIYCQDFIVKFT